jgi:glycosyltransferase involved in cell wall biosynthesis
LQRADFVVVPTESMAARLHELFSLGEARVVAIHPGVNERYVEPPKPSDVETLCSKHPFLEQPYLLALGSGANPDHGVPFLLEACAAAWQRDERIAPLVILASPSDSERITQAVRDHPWGEKVFVLESLPRELLPAFYRGAELLLEPCPAGGFGQAALEASACGVPCVVDPSCGVIDILADAALTIEPRPEAWTDAIERLHGEPSERERRGELGRKRASGRTWREVAARHWELYRA